MVHFLCLSDTLTCKLSVDSNKTPESPQALGQVVREAFTVWALKWATEVWHGPCAEQTSPQGCWQLLLSPAHEGRESRGQPLLV